MHPSLPLRMSKQTTRLSGSKRSRNARAADGGSPPSTYNTSSRAAAQYIPRTYYLGVSSRRVTCGTTRAVSLRYVAANKLVVIGAGGVGKTSLIVQFLEGLFHNGYKPTVEDCYRSSIQTPVEQAQTSAEEAGL
ncbi:hypothetical protein HPB49_022353 [Dermacentor silvarum]|uniref:Uncharacterized protein n=1 Tax=Dermacentor silvarum TaxID=543639 RepID=A0ACB8D8D9_DERSI|nr:hypothetical protein HPB49_022353 [Dermacentor silvarum]